MTDSLRAMEMVDQLVALVLQHESQFDRPRKANKTFDRMHEIEKALRQTPEGQDGLRGLMTHENEAVRLAAATTMLAVDPAAAEPALEQIVRDSETLNRTNAKYTLIEFREGKLNLDW